MSSRHSFLFPTFFLLASPYLVMGSKSFSLQDFRVDRDYIGVSITQWLINWVDNSVPIDYPNYGIDPNLQSLLNRIVKVSTMFDTIYFDMSDLSSEISDEKNPYFVSVISRSFAYSNNLLKKKSARNVHVIIQCSLSQSTCEFATHLAKETNKLANNTISTIVVDVTPPVVTGFSNEDAHSPISLSEISKSESETNTNTNLLINHCGTKVNPDLKMLLEHVDEFALQIVANLGAPANQPVDLFDVMTSTVQSCQHIIDLKKLQMILYKIEYINYYYSFGQWAYSWWLMGQYVRKHQVQAIIMDYTDLSINEDFMSIYLDKRWDANESVPYNVSYVYEPRSMSKWVNEETTLVVASVLTIVVLILVPILWAVYIYYIRPLQNQQYLTVTEVNDFFKGLPVQTLSDNPEWMKKKYTKSLEIKKSDFVLDETNKLGEGEFGIVYRGSLLTMNGCDVAFKTAKCSRNNIVGLKGLMSEIKILDYLGTHENIISLFGAYTANLRKGILYVAYEFCAVGCLHKYLEQLRPKQNVRTLDLSLMPNENEYVMETGFNDGDSFQQEEESEDEKNESELYKNLMKFSQDICAGMEYLAIKKIIHGDLATRNVLLTSTLKAKICDFGLSRRVYSYSEYVSKGELPMAWRWMAPETLSKKGVLSRKTDVWSYGITLWEIFSFGAVPFSGYNCDTAFVERLQYGMIRLPMPERCSQFFYDVMLSCWKINPAGRPNFTQLLETLTLQ